MLKELNNSNLLKVVKKVLIANIKNKIDFKNITNINNNSNSTLTDIITDCLYLDFKEFQTVLNTFNTPTFYRILNNVDFISDIFKILDYKHYLVDKNTILFLFGKNNDYMDTIDRCLYIIYNEILYNIIDIVLKNVDNICTISKKQIIDTIKKI